MKVRNLYVLLLLLLGSVRGYADEFRQPQSWFDVKWMGYYYLTAELEPTPGVLFHTGQKFELVNLTSGGGYAPLTVYEFQPVYCANPELVGEMILVNPAGGPRTKIAAEMGKNCRMFFYVETRLMMTPSIFTDSAE